MGFGGNTRPRRAFAASLERSQKRPEWTCHECGGTNPGNYLTCGNFHPTRKRIDDSPAICAARQPGVPYRADWKSMVD